jgi:hypothetical protein
MTGDAVAMDFKVPICVLDVATPEKARRLWVQHHHIAKFGALLRA